jgi:hypothetical protein
LRLLKKGQTSIGDGCRTYGGKDCRGWGISNQFFVQRERATSTGVCGDEAVDHQSIDDAFFGRLRAEFSDAEIVELGMAIGQYIGFGRLLKVLDVERPVCELER